ncbi:hypothetical protein F5B19DRAFT_466040 [Rostrohypoxylon terebratum]|nr:hypothetical protein F5B19DRAFT_466040 [Rostrohypoxylon terebratum]
MAFFPFIVVSVVVFFTSYAMVASFEMGVITRQELVLSIITLLSVGLVCYKVCSNSFIIEYDSGTQLEAKEAPRQGNLRIKSGWINYEIVDGNSIPAIAPSMISTFTDRHNRH